MPLSQDKQAEYMRDYRKKQKDSVIPSVIPKKHCSLRNCVICDYDELVASGKIKPYKR